MKFNNTHHTTIGIQAEVSLGLQRFLWYLIETMEVSPDRLQVFRLKPKGDLQHITHTQEQPPYRKEYDITVGRDESLVTAKIYVIDDGDYSTMLLSSEY